MFIGSACIHTLTFGDYGVSWKKTPDMRKEKKKNEYTPSGWSSCLLKALHGTILFFLKIICVMYPLIKCLLTESVFQIKIGLNECGTIGEEKCQPKVCFILFSLWEVITHFLWLYPFLETLLKTSTPKLWLDHWPIYKFFFTTEWCLRTPSQSLLHSEGEKSCSFLNQGHEFVSTHPRCNTEYV